MLDGYQLDGAAWLAGKPVAMLADEMGVGKTCQAVRAADLVQALTLTVICPAVLRTNWAREIERWSLWHSQPVVLEKLDDRVPKHGAVICSYNFAQSDQGKKALAARASDVLILDEAHAVKNAQAARSKAILGKAGIARSAQRTWFLTGTPAPNNASELYTFLTACGAVTGGFWKFAQQYCVVEQTLFGLKIIASKNHDQLRTLLEPYMLRRTQDDAGLQLPPMLTETVSVKGDLKALDGIDPETLALIEDAVARDDWTMADVPSVSTARRLIGLAKADASADLCEYYLQDGAGKSVIFAWHTAVIEKLNARLEKYGAAVIQGSTPPAVRQARIDAFQSDPAKRALICQITAAKEGLNLTAATTVEMVECSWTPSDNAQALARVRRRGQAKRTFARFYSVVNSIDDRVTRVVCRKSIDLAKIY